jgi:hypothetical protein
MPSIHDILQVEHNTDDALNLMEGIAEAFDDPGFRDAINFRRAEIVEQCRKLLAILTADDAAAHRGALIERRAD